MVEMTGRLELFIVEQKEVDDDILHELWLGLSEGGRGVSSRYI